jgi:large subunit ribosomal protein L23
VELVNVLLGPVVSEKSTDLANPSGGQGPNGRNFNPASKYVFRVHRDANKIEVRQAVEARFGVHVESVNTIKVPSKERGAGFVRIGKSRRGYQPAWKKAIVTLRIGEKIEDFFGNV